MKFTINNPLVLISAKVFGIGIELSLHHVDNKWSLCFQVEAVAWSYCKEWSRVR